MKKGIHPNYGKCIVKCAANGETWETRSTVPFLNVDITASCHPYITGKQRLVETGGRVDKFKKRMAKQ